MLGEYLFNITSDLSEHIIISNELSKSFKFGLTNSSKNTITLTGLNLVNYTNIAMTFDYQLGKSGSSFSSLTVTQYNSSSTSISTQTITNSNNTSYKTATIALQSACTKIIIVCNPAGSTYNTYVDNINITGTKKASCIEPTVVWQTEPANGVVGGTMKASATTNYPAGLTYTSSNTNVATIDDSGNIAYVATGSTAITATVTGDGNTYCDKTVTVSKQISVTCGNNVKISKGTETNGTFSISKTGTYGTCDGALVITLSNITPSTGYQFGEITQSGINTGVTIDQENKKVTYEQNTSGTSTINVTFNALPTHTVTWKVNGTEYKAGSPTTQVYDGGQVTTLPTAPDPANNCGEVFAGWTKTPIDGTTNTKPSVLFTTAENSPAITEPTTFHAVFAEYAN